jgi:large repetitive protein
MRFIAVLVVAFALAATKAQAQTPIDSEGPTLDVQLFHLTPGGNGFLTTESGDVNSSLALSIGFGLIYAKDPLKITLRQPDGQDEDIGQLVQNRLDAALVAGIGLFDVADLGVVVPMIYQGGFDEASFADTGVEAGEAPKSFTLGDVRLVPKVRFLNVGDGALSMALVATVIVPTAAQTPFAGENNLVYAPSLAVSSRNDMLRFGVNFGYRYRERTRYTTLIVDDELFAKLAIALNLTPGADAPTEIIGEVFGHTAAQNPLGRNSSEERKDFAAARTSAEGDLGLRMHLSDTLSVTFGAGGGLVPGYGAPAIRGFASMMYYSGSAGVTDEDRDGIGDDRDKCVDKKEDKDQFEDDDGCPEVDNDKDNVLDEDDQCPNDPEDKDGYEDENGCPEPDNDNDGLLDADDKCPTDAEDIDQFQDEDGCSDVDNDNDGIADAVDKCPIAAEDIDQFQDSDGCPEPDNDGDGLTDLGDLCPNNPEDKDGVADDDGCAEDNDGDGLADADDKCPNEAEIYNGIDDSDGCPEKLKTKSLVEVTAEKIEIKDKIFFKTGSDEILPKSYGLLDQVAAVMKNYKHLTKIRVEGHTDATGPRKKNLKLSKDRAESVRKYLIDKGVEPERLDSEGFGPDKPIGSNKTAKGKELNRRVEFVIAEQKAIGLDVSEPKEAPAAPAAPASPGEQPKKDDGMFQMDIGPEEAPPPPEEPKKGKKSKAKKQKKKEEDDGGVEFNF